jgi:dihydrofolate reductase
MYETMCVWETNQQLANQSKLFEQFAEIWKAADKVVYSGSLEQCVTKNTRIERQFDPVEVRQMKDSATLDLTISGATLAAHGIDHGLVDETHLLIYPIVVGSGKHVLPLTVRRELELIEQRSFTNGVVYVRYRHHT